MRNVISDRAEVPLPSLGAEAVTEQMGRQLGVARDCNEAASEPDFLTRGRRILSGEIQPDDYLTTPEEIHRDVESHYQRVAEESGIIATAAARHRTRMDWTLSHHFGGLLVLCRRTEQGVIVLAVGDKEVGAVEQAFKVDARSGFGREVPLEEDTF